MTKNKKIAIASIFVLVLSTVAVLAATLYPNALVSFTGMDLVTNGTTTQAFVDITLKNINSSGVSFCLKYNTDYILLSNVADNTPIENPSPTATGAPSKPDMKPVNLEHKYFEQNSTDFPIGCFKDENVGSSQPKFFKNYPIIGIADQDSSKADSETGYLIMNFLPNVKSSDLGDHIKVLGDVSDGELLDDEDLAKRLHIMADESKDGLYMGRLSFYVKDAKKLMEDNPKDLIKIIPFTSMDALADGDEGVYISYLDENGDKQWYTDKDNNVECKISLEPTIQGVKLQQETLEVSSYDIYKNGTSQDLLDFLNTNMNMVTLTYMDGTEQPDKITWTSDDIKDIQYDPKGDKEYVVEHKYNDDFTVQATVKVKPVTLVGFDYDNKDITYLSGATDYPTDLEGLKFPQKARPILDTYVPNKGIEEVEVYCADTSDSKQITQFTDIPQGLQDGTAGDYEFPVHVSNSVNLLNTPWLTVPGNNLPAMSVVRHVVATEDELPDKLIVVSAQIGDDGVLTIVVENPDKDTNPIPQNTKFTIKLPDGELLNDGQFNGVTLDSPSQYEVSIDQPGTGQATIKINPDIGIDAQKKLVQLINLGGGFSIASQEPDKNPGPYTDFNVNARNNYYTDGNAADGNYEFDYSGDYAAMFPVKAGSTLPNTVTLPRPTDRINTVYNGFDGTEPGELETFTVDENGWQISGNINTIGEIITATGTLANYTYTNYGYIANPASKNYTVTIKYKVVKSEGPDQIADIDDFTYSTQQVGYDYDDLQNKAFTVQNTATEDIHGLTAVISTSTDSSTTGKMAFVETKKLSQLLKKGESTTFDISTKIGMPIGKYVSTVDIYSNNGLLKSFTITFEVVAEPVNKITLNVKEEGYGTAKTDNDQYTAQQGKTVKIIAEPKDNIDYIFKGWTCSDTNVVFADASKEETTFVMPGNDVTITANFEETEAAKLRLSELIVKDASDNNQTLNDKDWKTITFDPVTREYFVVVANDVEKVKLWFKVIATAESADKKLAHTYDTTTDTININNKDSTDMYYKSDESSALVLSPKENLLTLTLTSDTDSTVTKDYKIHVYRKVKPEDTIKFNYGNSPYGLIMSDSAIVSDTDKNQAKSDFVSNGYKFTAANAPDGATAGVYYRPEAWISNNNKDLSETALFVTDKSSIIDPGYSSIQNSIGGTVDTSTITRTIKVRVLNASGSSQNGSSDDFSMVNNDDTVIKLSASGPITELKDLRIRPDCYELTYSFKDFDGTTTSVSRPIIILSPLGDVNISGTTDNDDKQRILDRFKTDLANNHNVKDYDTGGRLNKFRICDVNKDGSVNAVDANYIRAGTLVPFYIDIVGGGS